MPLLHAYIAFISNNPNVTVTCIAGLIACWFGIGWCLRSLVVEWHTVNIVSVQRSIIGLHLGGCSLYFAREVVYS